MKSGTTDDQRKKSVCYSSGNERHEFSYLPSYWLNRITAGFGIKKAIEVDMAFNKETENETTLEWSFRDMK